MCTIVFGVLLLGCTKDEVQVGSQKQEDFGFLRDGHENHSLRDPLGRCYCVREKGQFLSFGRITYLLNTNELFSNHALEHTIYPPRAWTTMTAKDPELDWRKQDLIEQS